MASPHAARSLSVPFVVRLSGPCTGWRDLEDNLVLPLDLVFVLFVVFFAIIQQHLRCEGDVLPIFLESQRAMEERCFFLFQCDRECDIPQADRKLQRKLQSLCCPFVFGVDLPQVSNRFHSSLMV